jgi:hypothetical protein
MEANGPDSQNQPNADPFCDPVSFSGGFLVGIKPPLWFTPRHIVTMIQGQESVIVANPPFGPTTRSC